MSDAPLAEILITPVILSGGSGTRLWPLSTPAQPKQFRAMVGESSMLRQTLDRVADRTCFSAPIIVCGGGHVAHVERELAEAGIADARIIIEPAARNTAPAIALAAHALAESKDDATMLVMPSDHVMADATAFLAAVTAALPAVRTGALATFGIEPDGPETGYGYIARGGPLADAPGLFAVSRFVEKPELAQAQAMLNAGGHYWNAGIFLMRADAYLSALTASAPAIAAACAAAMRGAHHTGAETHPNKAAFLSSPADSIDYAVMEHADQVVVTPVDPGWSDVGSWSAIHALSPKDERGNAVNGAVIAIDAADNLLRAAPGKRIAVVGVSGLIVVAEGDDILIIPHDRAQDVKRIIDQL